MLYQLSYSREAVKSSRGRRAVNNNAGGPAYTGPPALVDPGPGLSWPGIRIPLPARRSRTGC